MHELSLCRSIHDIVDRVRDGRQVSTVNVRVGQLRQVVPDTLASCWGLVSADGPLAGSQLVVDHAPVVLGCRGCGENTTLADALVLACGSCGSTSVDLVGGEELLVTSVDLVKEQ